MGDDSLIPAMVTLAITDRHSKRVFGKARDGLTFMDCDKGIAEIARQLAGDTYLVDAASLADALTKQLEYTQFKLKRDTKTMMDTSASLRERLMEVSTLRTYNYHAVLPLVAELILNKSENKQIRLAALDAFSWYTHSYQRPLILATCDKILADAGSDEDLKEQALRTRNRMHARL